MNTVDIPCFHIPVGVQDKHLLHRHHPTSSLIKKRLDFSLGERKGGLSGN
jgi:hypothetical protein